jgi:hypothetical protein
LTRSSVTAAQAAVHASFNMRDAEGEGEKVKPKE